MPLLKLAQSREEDSRRGCEFESQNRIPRRRSSRNSGASSEETTQQERRSISSENRRTAERLVVWLGSVKKEEWFGLLLLFPNVKSNNGFRSESRVRLFIRVNRGKKLVDEIMMAWCSVHFKGKAVGVGVTSTSPKPRKLAGKGEQSGLNVFVGVVVSLENRFVVVI